MVSVVFIGFSVGNVISGTIGDRFGRRQAVLLSYFMIGAFGMSTAYATNALMMVSLRFCVGVGCGIGFPAVYSLIPEVCPTAYRGRTSTLMIGCMPVGELFAAIGVLLIDPNLDRSTKECEIFGVGTGRSHTRSKAAAAVGDKDVQRRGLPEFASNEAASTEAS